MSILSLVNRMKAWYQEDLRKSKIRRERDARHGFRYRVEALRRNCYSGYDQDCRLDEPQYKILETKIAKLFIYGDRALFQIFSDINTREIATIAKNKGLSIDDAIKYKAYHDSSIKNELVKLKYVNVPQYLLVAVSLTSISAGFLAEAPFIAATGLLGFLAGKMMNKNATKNIEQERYTLLLSANTDVQKYLPAMSEANPETTIDTGKSDEKSKIKSYSSLLFNALKASPNVEELSRVEQTESLEQLAGDIGNEFKSLARFFGIEPFAFTYTDGDLHYKVGQFIEDEYYGVRFFSVSYESDQGLMPIYTVFVKPAKDFSSYLVDINTPDFDEMNQEVIVAPEDNIMKQSMDTIGFVELAKGPGVGSRQYLEILLGTYKEFKHIFSSWQFHPKNSEAIKNS